MGKGDLGSETQFAAMSPIAKLLSQLIRLALTVPWS